MKKTIFIFTFILSFLTLNLTFGNESHDSKCEKRSLPSDFLEKIQNITRPSCDGPNCWNSVLLYHNLASARFSDYTETANFLSTCIKKENGQNIKEGDIGVIRNDHAFIVYPTLLDSSTIITKNGFSSNAPYKLSSLQKVAKVYESKIEDIIFYDCSNSSYLHPQNNKTEFEAQEIIKELEHLLSDNLLNLSEPYPDKIIDMQSTFFDLVNKLDGKKLSRFDRLKLYSFFKSFIYVLDKAGYGAFETIPLTIIDAEEQNKYYQYHWSIKDKFLQFNIETSSDSK